MTSQPKKIPALDLPGTLPVLVLQDSVLLPGSMVGLEVDDEDAELARQQTRNGPPYVVVVAAKRSEEEAARSSDAGDDEDGEGEPTGGEASGRVEVELHGMGVAARILRVTKDQEGQHTILLQGVTRVHIEEIVSREPQLSARVSAVVARERSAAEGAAVAALALEVKKLSREILELLPGVPREVGAAVQAMQDPGELADVLAHRVPASVEEKQRALEELDVEKRLALVVALLARRREVLKLSSKIDSAVHQQVSKAEKEHMLRQRLAAIRKELGEDEGGKNGADALEQQLAAAGLPAEVKAQVDKELARLKQLPAQSPETSVARTWLQSIADLPWSKRSEDNLDLANAQGVLDADHEGLEKVKKRVVSYLAVRSLKNDMKGPILCLVGPPGVGKTSLGQSIARAMGRKLVRVALGGVRDEAEIRGHRRTYVGALPGRIVQAMKRAGTRNPVVLLDEVDKLGQGHGDPAAALLEVLDPEQNNTFTDHYLEVPFDLSGALFIATANTLETVPAPLRDRMEVLEIPSYTVDEKVAIAKKHLWQKQVEAHGLSGARVSIEDAALKRLVLGHTREAGVRGLEKRVADVCRALAVERASGGLPEGAERLVTEAEIESLVGPDKFEPEQLDRTATPGVATGLAWTPVGGDVLFVEAIEMPGKGRLVLSGQLGDVMRESAQAALSYVKANASALGLPVNAFEGKDLHIHVPAGATPKDGPSAGVTLFVALVSLLTSVRVRGDVAMTGELTLRGRVLPVGGIKEKVLAAHRLGIKRIVLPLRNLRDLADVPEAARKELEIVPVTTLEEALAATLEASVLRGLRPLPEIAGGEAHAAAA